MDPEMYDQETMDRMILTRPLNGVALHYQKSMRPLLMIKRTTMSLLMDPSYVVKGVWRRKRPKSLKI